MIVGFIVTVLLLAVFLTALIVAACKMSGGWVLAGVWAAIILLFATYPAIHFMKEYPYNPYEKNKSKLYKMLADGASEEKIKPLLRKGAGPVENPELKAEMLREADEIIALLLEYGATEE